LLATNAGNQLDNATGSQSRLKARFSRPTKMSGLVDKPQIGSNGNKKNNNHVGVALAAPNLARQNLQNKLHS